MNTPKARLGGKGYAKGCVKNIRSSLILCGSTQLCAVKSVLNIGRTDAEAETPILWLHDAKNWLIGKDRHAGRDGRWEEKGTTEDEMTGWHHWLHGHGLSKLWKLVMDKEAWRSSLGSQRVGHDWVTELCAVIVFSIPLGFTEMSVYSCSLVKTAGPNESGGWWWKSERRQVDFLHICGRPDEMTAKANALTFSPPHLLALQS